MNSCVISYAALGLIALHVSLFSMENEDKATKFKVSYKLDETCFKRFVPHTKKQNGAREFTKFFVLKNTPFEQKFCQFDTSSVPKNWLCESEIKKQESSKTLLSSAYSCATSVLSVVGLMSKSTSTHSETQQQMDIFKAPLFNWEKPCCVVPAETELKSGHKNILQDMCGTHNVTIYDIPSGEKIINKKPVVKVVWSDDATCCAVIQKESESSMLYKVFLRDFKNNKEDFGDCAAPGPDGLSHFIECDNDPHFVTKMDNILYLTRIRPEGMVRMIGKKDCAMVKAYFCDKYVWIHYKEKRKEVYKKDEISVPSEQLIVYEIAKDGFKEIAEVTVSNSLKYIFDPYGVPDNKQYISFCWDGLLHVFDAATAKVVYKNKQKPGGRLVGMWNEDGTLYAVSDVTAKGNITVHDTLTDTAVELKNPDNEIMIADGGFQDSYVGVSLAHAFMVYDCKNGDLVQKIPIEKKPKNTLLEYGFCAPNCVYICTEEEATIYNFIEKKIKVNIPHLPSMRVSTYSKNYCGCAVTTDLKKIELVNIMTAWQRTFSYDKVHDFWFNSTGDRLLVVHGERGNVLLDIIETLSGKLIMSIKLNSYADRCCMSLDNSLCAVMLDGKKTVVVYDLCDISRPLQILRYKDDVTSITFDEAVTVFVVTTGKETYAYSVLEFVK